MWSKGLLTSIQYDGEGDSEDSRGHPDRLSLDVIFRRVLSLSNTVSSFVVYIGLDRSLNIVPGHGPDPVTQDPKVRKKDVSRF